MTTDAIGNNTPVKEHDRGFAVWFGKKYKRTPDVEGTWYDRDQKLAWDAAISYIKRNYPQANL